MFPQDSPKNPLAPRQYDLASRAPIGSPIIVLTNLILEEGLRSKASAISLVASAESCLVRYSIAGEWQEVMKVPDVWGKQVMNRLRLMAGLEPTTKGRRTGEIHCILDGALVILTVDAPATPDGSQKITVTTPGTAA